MSKRNNISPKSEALFRIIDERNRQEKEEGYTAEHDDQHGEGQLLSWRLVMLYRVGHTKTREIFLLLYLP